MKSFFKQFIFISIAVIVFGIGIFAVIAVNNRGAAPVAYWKFDEGYGSTTFDAAGSNDGTIYNALWRNEPDCKTGKCLYFDGSGDYVSVADSASLDASTGVTVAVWIKLNSIDAITYIFNKGDAYFLGRIDSSFGANTTFGVYKSGVWADVNLPTEMSLNVWHYIVGVYDATGGSNNLKIYLDGALQAQGTTTGNINNGGAATISSATAGQEVDGFIDDVRIYNYARTASQIKADYAAGAGGRGASVVQSSKFKVQSQSEGLVGHWKMDESSWTVDCSTDTVMDSSGNAKHGDACPNAGGLAPAAGKYGNAGVFDGTEDYVAIPDVDF